MHLIIVCEERRNDQEEKYFKVLFEKVIIVLFSIHSISLHNTVVSVNLKCDEMFKDSKLRGVLLHVNEARLDKKNRQ